MTNIPKERTCDFPDCGEKFRPKNRNSNVRYCPKHTGGRPHGQAADGSPDIALGEEQLDRLKGFLDIRGKLPPVPDKVLATRVEDMGFDTPQEAVALFGDLHYLSKIDRRATGGLAEYNPDIARERLIRWRDGLLRFTQMDQLVVQLDTLHIFALGDELEGHGKMFPSQGLQMSESLLWQVMGFVEDMTEVVLAFLSRYKKVIVYKVPGNHGRIAERARGAYTPDNAELFAWEIIGERLRSQCGGEWVETANGVHSLTGGLIDLHIHRHFFAAAQILQDEEKDWPGWFCLGRHGQGIKGLDATYTGAYDTKLRMNALFGEIIHYYFQGHNHEAQSAEKEIGGEVIQNGCFVGASLLSLERARAAASLPSQEFLLLHPKYGKTHHHRIHLATADEVRRVEVIGREGK